MGGTRPAFVGLAFIQQFNVQGFAPSSFFYQRVVSSTIQKLPILPFPIGTNPMCEGGTDLGLGNGTVVPCSQAPRIYQGRPTPSWNGSFSATLRLGQRLRILSLIDYLGGSTILVGDVRSVNSTCYNSKVILSGTDQIASGYVGNNLLNGKFASTGALGLFKGGFARLRTVSATYDFAPSMARWVGASRGSLTLAVENMAFLWRAQKDKFGIKWIDPEIVPNRSTDTTGNLGYPQETWPQLARAR